MELKRSLTLTQMFLRSIVNRIVYDLIRELVVAICSLVLISLFIYMFQDFIKVKLAMIDGSQQAAFAQIVSLSLAIATSLYVGRTLRNWRRTPESLERLSHRLGEEPRVVGVYFALKTTLLHLTALSLLGYTVHRFLYDASWAETLSVGLICLGVSHSFLLLPVPKEEGLRYKAISLFGGSRLSFLMAWRIHQMVLRNSLTKLCLLIALVFAVMTGFISFLALPFPLAILSSLGSGFLLTGALVFQLQDDMEHPWLERQCGVTHNEIIGCYLGLGLSLGLALGLLNFGLWLLQAPADLKLYEALKIVAVAATSPSTFTALMFQVDPRRPGLQFITSFIVSLFLGTAIFAHWLGVLLLPILIYYGHQYQQDGFYKST